MLMRGLNLGPRRWTQTLAGAFCPGLLGLGVASCADCDSKPYVPYHIGDDAGASPSAAGDAATADATAPKLPMGASKEAPPGAKRWSEGGLELLAPGETHFVRGLFQDFDGDGRNDALVVLAQPESGRAQIAWYSTRSEAPAGEPRASLSNAIVLAEPKLEREPCTLTVRLEPAGGSGALIEVGCAGGEAENSPLAVARRLYVLSARGQALALRAEATLLDGPEIVSVEGSTDDRDGDGQNDVMLTFRVHHGAGSKSRPLSVVWLDRPAGLSRDLAEPEATLLKLAREAESRAKSAKDARVALELSADVRSLARVLCGPSPRVKFSQPSLSCGESRALSLSAQAKLRAFATLKEPHNALAAYDESRALLKGNKEAEKLALGTVTAVPLREIRSLRAQPEPTPKAPVYGPLTFEPEGSLIVKTAGELVRVDTQSWEESVAPGLRYLATVASPDGAYSWLEVYDPCDGLSLRATLAPITVGDVLDIALPIPASLGKCGARGEPRRGAPLHWEGQGLEALVEGYPLRIDLSARSAALALPSQTAPQAPGSARSPDGRSFITPTSLGLLIGPSGKLLTHAELTKGGELTGCAVANAGAMAACVRNGRAVVFVP